MAYLRATAGQSRESLGSTELNNLLAGATPDATEFSVLDGVTPGTVTAGKAVVTTTNKHIDALVISDGGLALGSGAGTAISATAAELNKADGIAAAASLVVAAEVTFTETSVAGTYTGSVTVPAGATILDIQVRNVALWTAATSASMIVGDGVDPNGWYDAIDLKATDLELGEVIRFGSPGGQEGVYLVSATGLLNTSYSALERVITGVIVTVTTAGSTAGRTRMLVVYVLPTASAAVKS